MLKKNRKSPVMPPTLPGRGSATGIPGGMPPMGGPTPQGMKRGGRVMKVKKSKKRR